MTSPLSRFRLLPTVLLVTSLAGTPLLAQDPGDGGPPGGRRMGGGAGMGQRPSFDPVVLEGPPAPAQMDSLAGLDGAQHERYAALYQNLMNSTQSEREEVRARREAMRNGTDQGGDRRQGFGATRETMQSLSGSQAAFDNALKDFLRKDQLKHYNDWREQRRKEARDRFRGRGGPGR